MVFIPWTTRLLLVLLFSTCEMLVIRHQPLWPHTQATFMPLNVQLQEKTGTFPTILTPFAKAAYEQSTESAEHPTFVPPTDHGANDRAARPVVQSTSAPVDGNKSTDSIAQPSSLPNGNGPARPVVQSTKASIDDVTKMNVDRASASLVDRADDKATDSPADPSDVPIGIAAARPVVQSTSGPVDDNDDVTKTNVVRTFAPSLKNAEDKSTDSPAQPSAVPIGDGTEGNSTESAESKTMQPIIGGLEDRSSNAADKPSSPPVADEHNHPTHAAHKTSAPIGNGVDDDHTHSPTQGSDNIGSNSHPATGYPVNGTASEATAEPKASPIGHGTDNDHTQKIDDDHTFAPIGSISHDDSTDSAESHTVEPILDYLEDKSSDAGDQPSSPPESDEHNHHTHADDAPTYVPLGYGVDKITDEPATEDPSENINHNDNHPATEHPPMFSRSM